MMLQRPPPITNSFYTTYDRRLLPEYEDDDDVQTTKNEIKNVKKDTISSTQNAIRIAAQAEATGVDILERLGVQEEKLLNTEENLEEASIEIHLGGEKLRKIKRLKRSLWGSIFRNPFAIIRRARRVQKIEERRLQLANTKRERRDATKASKGEHQAHPVELGDLSSRDELTNPSATQQHTERMRYQFEADSEDEEMEKEIEDNTDLLYSATIRLKDIGLAIDHEVNAQNRLANRIRVKIDKAEDDVALNSHRQDRL